MTQTQAKLIVGFVALCELLFCDRSTTAMADMKPGYSGCVDYMVPGEEWIPCEPVLIERTQRGSMPGAVIHVSPPEYQRPRNNWGVRMIDTDKPIRMIAPERSHGD